MIDRVVHRAGSLGLTALGLFVALGLVAKLPERPVVACGAALVALGAGALAAGLDRRFTLPAAVLGTIAIVGLAGGDASNVGWFALCVYGAWCVLGGRRWDGLIFWLGGLALLAIEWLVVSDDPGWGAWMAGLTFSMIAVTFVRHEIALVEQLREAQAGLAERSRAEERNRIARDLHDVIAHSLTVSLLHVSSARLAVEHEPEEAAAALAEAERLGRQSLDEVRSVVGLLGSADGKAALTPARGVGDLDELVAGFRRAGAEITIVVVGELDALPATTGSVVYRILQEALTNAARHAPGSRTAVRIAVAPDEVELIVDSGGAPGSGVGRGTLGMRQRAEALGGRCVAGPHGEGWRVHARLPVGPPAEAVAP